MLSSSIHDVSPRRFAFAERWLDEVSWPAGVILCIVAFTGGWLIQAPLPTSANGGMSSGATVAQPAVLPPVTVDEPVRADHSQTPSLIDERPSSMTPVVQTSATGRAASAESPEAAKQSIPQTADGTDRVLAGLSLARRQWKPAVSRSTNAAVREVEALATHAVDEAKPIFSRPFHFLAGSRTKSVNTSGEVAAPN